MNITNEQLYNLIKLSGTDINPEEATETDITKALVAIEKKLNFFKFPLSFFITENLNVLIVDDLELSIYQLTTMLTKLGINVYVSRNKEEAISELKKKKFDYIIVDLFLPDYEDGHEVIKFADELRQKSDKDYKIIVVSGTDDPKIVEECYKNNIDEFISKQPLWHEDILKYIAHNTKRAETEEFQRYVINQKIAVYTIYKINNEKYVNKILKEVNSDILTGYPHIIFNMEHVKLLSDEYTRIFTEIYKSTVEHDGIFAIIKPSEIIQKALNYVFLDDVISTFNTLEDAVEYIELNSI